MLSSVALSAAPTGSTKDYSHSQSQLSSSGDKWPMYLQLEGKKGNFRDIARLSWMVPLWQDDTSMLFGDVRLMMDNRHDREANIGLGYRHIVRDWDMGSDGIVLGAYAFFDRRKSSLGNKYNQGTFGVEALGDYFKLSANYYMPQNKKYHVARRFNPSITRSGWNVVDKQVVFTFNTLLNPTDDIERTLKGYDVELRGKIPVTDVFNIWGGVGAYRFSRSGLHRNGPMAMVDVELLDGLGIDGSRASLGFEYRKDKGFKANRYGVLKLTTPLAKVGKGKDYPSLTGVEYEMTRFISRDVDIQTGVKRKAVNREVFSSGNAGAIASSIDGENITTDIHVSDLSLSSGSVLSALKHTVDHIIDSPLQIDLDIGDGYEEITELILSKKTAEDFFTEVELDRYLLDYIEYKQGLVSSPGTFITFMGVHDPDVAKGIEGAAEKFVITKRDFRLALGLLSASQKSEKVRKIAFPGMSWNEKYVEQAIDLLKKEELPVIGPMVTTSNVSVADTGLDHTAILDSSIVEAVHSAGFATADAQTFIAHMKTKQPGEVNAITHTNAASSFDSEVGLAFDLNASIKSKIPITLNASADSTGQVKPGATGVTSKSFENGDNDVTLNLANSASAERLSGALVEFESPEVYVGLAPKLNVTKAADVTSTTDTKDVSIVKFKTSADAASIAAALTAAPNAKIKSNTANLALATVHADASTAPLPKQMTSTGDVVPVHYTVKTAAGFTALKAKVEGDASYYTVGGLHATNTTTTVDLQTAIIKSPIKDIKSDFSKDVSEFSAARSIDSFSKLKDIVGPTAFTEVVLAEAIAARAKEASGKDSKNAVSPVEILEDPDALKGIFAAIKAEDAASGASEAGVALGDNPSLVAIQSTLSALTAAHGAAPVIKLLDNVDDSAVLNSVKVILDSPSSEDLVKGSLSPLFDLEASSPAFKAVAGIGNSLLSPTNPAKATFTKLASGEGTKLDQASALTDVFSAIDMGADFGSKLPNAATAKQYVSTIFAPIDGNLGVQAKQSASLTGFFGNLYSGEGASSTLSALGAGMLNLSSNGDQ